MLPHTLFVKFWPKPEGPATAPVSEAAAAKVPARVTRHSLAARTFHWVMAAALPPRLGPASAPVLGLQLNWIATHWIAGLVLTASIVYHVIHASFWLDFWSIWVGPEDLPQLAEEIRRQIRRGRARP